MKNIKNIGTERRRTERDQLKRTFKIKNAFFLSKTRSKSSRNYYYFIRPPLPQSPFRVREGRFRLKEIVFYNSFIYLYNIIEILIMKFFLNLQILERSDRGGYRGGEHSPPPEFGIFCSYFQNSFSIACLRERNQSAKQKKYLS